jgi:prepilin-type N-terminal cleavage/methylation domain-containing protein
MNSRVCARPRFTLDEEQDAMTHRRGLTQIEVLVVIAIVAVLVGLLLPAIQAVRMAAFATRSRNQLRQIALAMHSYAGANNGHLPNDERLPGPIQVPRLGEIGPYLEESYSGLHVRAFINPADLTADPARYRMGLASYGLNWQVFKDADWPKMLRKPNLSATFHDGTANTILIAELYAVCDGVMTCWPSLIPDPTSRPAVFGAGIAPVTSGLPPVSVASIGHKTFQVRPCTGSKGDCGRWERCNPLLAQTPFGGGMHVAMADASVRAIAPSISEQTYWAAVTPAGGEVLGSDW